MLAEGEKSGMFLDDEKIRTKWNEKAFKDDMEKVYLAFNYEINANKF